MKKFITLCLMLFAVSAIAKSASGTVIMYVEFHDDHGGDRSIISGFDSMDECNHAIASFDRQTKNDRSGNSESMFDDNHYDHFRCLDLSK